MAPSPTHRTVTRRVLLVSVVVGVVLAVASVPVAAVMLVYAPLGGPSTELGFDAVDGQPVLINVSRYPTATLWQVQSVPSEVPVDIANADLAFGPGYTSNIGTLPEMSGMAVLPDGTMWVFRAGWPVHAATAFKVLGPPEASTGVVGGIAMTARGDYIVVPYIPLALGMIANTLFYATLAFAAIAGLGLLRTRRRRARGQCLACGYALDDGMSECPECGLSTQAS